MKVSELKEWNIKDYLKTNTDLALHLKLNLDDGDADGIKRALLLIAEIKGIDLASDVGVKE